MSAIKGSKVKLKQGDGASPAEAFTTIAGSRNVTYSVEGSDGDTTSQDDVHAATGETWTSDIPGTLTFTANSEMLVKDKTVFAGLIADRIAGTVRSYQLEIEGVGTFEGLMRLSAFSGSGQFSEAAQYTIGVRSQGRVTFTAAA